MRWACHARNEKMNNRMRESSHGISVSMNMSIIDVGMRRDRSADKNKDRRTTHCSHTRERQTDKQTDRQTDRHTPVNKEKNLHGLTTTPPTPLRTKKHPP